MRSPAVPRLLAEMVERATAKVGKKRGFTASKILTEWPRIVGAEIAAHCVPVKIAHDRYQQYGASLHVQCDPGWAMEVQYQEAQIIERIAGYFGHRAVSRLVITQAALPVQAQVSTAPFPCAPKAAPLAAEITDPALREVLEKLNAARERKDRP